MRRPVLVLMAFAVTVFFGTTAGAAQDAAKFYEDNCAVCHTIGEGPQAGPDLKGVTARRDRGWLIRFMLDPEAFASDPEVARMSVEAGGVMMPATAGLTREMAGAILGLIEQRSGTSPAAAPAAAEPPFTAADVARGRDLFVGSARLSASGPACITCHESGDMSAPAGGRLGPELTRVYDRLGGRRGLNAWLGAPPTPMMRAVYGSASLTRDESRALTAFLEQSARTGTPHALRLPTFVASGVGAAAAVFVLVGLVGAKRFRAVRRPLVEATRDGIRTPPRHAPGAAGSSAPGRGATAASNLGGPR
jgi:cytochrome c2